MEENFDDFPSLKESLVSIENLKKYNWPIYDETKYESIEKFTEEIFSKVFQEFKILPNIVLPTKCKDFKFGLFRVRELSTFTDINIFSEHSYPPIGITKMGRCNFPKKPIFYCSNNPGTSLFEVVRESDFKNKQYCISRWQVNPSDDYLFFENYLQTELDEENNFKIFRDILREKLNETFKGKLSDDKMSGLINFLEFLDNSFINDESYAISASIAYRSFFPKHNMGTDILMYPSRQSLRKSVNFAISPNFVNNNLSINRFYIVSINDIKKDKSSFNISFLKYGDVDNRKIMWKNITEKDSVFEEHIKQDFGESFYKNVLRQSKLV